MDILQTKISAPNLSSRPSAGGLIPKQFNTPNIAQGRKIANQIKAPLSTEPEGSAFKVFTQETLTTQNISQPEPPSSGFEHEMGRDVLKISQIVQFARLTSPEPKPVLCMADGTEQVLE